jgi:hypothetical protein
MAARKTQIHDCFKERELESEREARGVSRKAAIGSNAMRLFSEELDRYVVQYSAQI